MAAKRAKPEKKPAAPAVKPPTGRLSAARQLRWMVQINRMLGGGVLPSGLTPRQTIAIADLIDLLPEIVAVLNTHRIPLRGKLAKLRTEIDVTPGDKP